jgi:hypothetical protein
MDNMGRGCFLHGAAGEAVVSQVGVNGVERRPQPFERFREWFFTAVNFSNEDGGVYLILEEVLDETTADKAGRAGNKNAHIYSQ